MGAIDGCSAQPAARELRGTPAMWLAVALGWLALAVPAAAFDQVAVPNAEDLALAADGRWVIASSMSAEALHGGGGGALYAVDVRSGAARRLPSNDRAVATGGYDNCAGPRAPAEFGPHGIALHADGDDRQRLFVVNHTGRESIEVYAVTDRDPLTLGWVDCLELPAGAFGNAVASSADGTLFVTNMGSPTDGSKPAQRWMNGVLRWRADHGWDTVPDSEVHGANGLLVSADGRTLFVASWAGRALVRLATTSDGSPARATLELPFMPDNLRWGADGRLFATGMQGDVAAVSACVMGTGSCDKLDTTVARIDGATMTLECMLRVPLTMGTVALPVGGALWVGPVRGAAIQIVSAAALEAACSS